MAVFDGASGSLTREPIHIGGAGDQKGNAVDFLDGSLVIGITYRGETTLYARNRGPETLSTSGSGDWDLLVAKYTYDGDLLWHRSIGSTTVLGLGVIEQVKGVAVAANGDVVISGTLTGSVAVGGKTYAPDDLLDTAKAMGFVAKLHGGDGGLAWFHTFAADIGATTCCEIVLDAADNAYVTPQLHGTTLFHSDAPAMALLPGVVATAGQVAGAVIVFDTAGAVLSARPSSTAAPRPETNT